MEEVILVNKNDKAIGKEEKLVAHQRGKLHRCFSIFLINDNNDWLLQQRAKNKYHNAGLWSNSCCGHPRPGEVTIEAAKRRLREELGIAAELAEIFTFRYKTKFSNGLWENEYDHVFCGRTNAKPRPNPNEVAACCWFNLETLRQEISEKPENFTYWFKKCYRKVIKTVMPAKNRQDNTLSFILNL